MLSLREAKRIMCKIIGKPWKFFQTISLFNLIDYCFLYFVTTVVVHAFRSPCKRNVTDRKVS